LSQPFPPPPQAGPRVQEIAVPTAISCTKEDVKDWIDFSTVAQCPPTPVEFHGVEGTKKTINVFFLSA